MSSLVDQLRKLKAATQQPAGPSQIPSLLFTQDQAAKLSSDDIWEIGLSGYNELCQQDEKTFAPFHALFSPASKEYPRSMQTKASNKLLNVQLTSFLRSLSGYFVLPAAHKTLEWLIRHYQAHQHNVEAMVECALPYHTTKVFVRIMQLLHFKTLEHRFKLFQAVKNTGAPLDRDLIVLRSRTIPQLLRFIASRPSQILADPNPPSKLSAMYKVFVSVLTGIFDEQPSENMLSLLLPYLLTGIKSQHTEFRTSTYMVLMKLFSSASLSEDVVSSLASALSESAKHDVQATLPCIISLYSTQQKRIMPQDALKSLVNIAGFEEALADASAGHLITQFLDMFAIALGESLNNEIEIPDYLVRIVKQTSFAKQQTVSIASDLLDQYLRVQRSTADSDDKAAYRKVLQDVIADLERCNPMVIDSTIHKWAAANPDASTEDSKLVHDYVSMALQSQRLQVVDKTDQALFLSLKHPESSIRGLAMDQLLSLLNSDKDFGELDLTFFRNALLEALSDSAEEVLTKCFEHPELLKKYVGERELGKKLSSLLTSENFPLIAIKNATALMAEVCSDVQIFKAFFHQLILSTKKNKKNRTVILALSKTFRSSNKKKKDDTLSLFSGMDVIVKHTTWKTMKKSVQAETLAEVNEMLLDTLSSNLKDLYEQDAEHPVFVAAVRACEGKFSVEHRLAGVMVLSHSLRFGSDASQSEFVKACVHHLAMACLSSIRVLPKGAIQSFPHDVTSESGGVSRELCLSALRLLDISAQGSTNNLKLRHREYVVAFQNLCRVLKFLPSPPTDSMLSDWSVHEDPPTATTEMYVSVLVGIFQMNTSPVQQHALKLFFTHVAPECLRLTSALWMLPSSTDYTKYNALRVCQASLTASAKGNNDNASAAAQIPFMLPHLLSALCSSVANIRVTAVQVLLAAQSVLKLSSSAARTPSKKKNRGVEPPANNSGKLSAMSAKNSLLFITWILSHKMELESDSEQVKIFLQDMAAHAKKHPFAKEVLDTLISTVVYFIERGFTSVALLLIQPITLVRTPEKYKSFHPMMDMLINKADGNTAILSEDENRLLMTLVTGISGKKIVKLLTTPENEYFQTILKVLDTQYDNSSSSSISRSNVGGEETTSSEDNETPATTTATTSTTADKSAVVPSPRTYLLQKGITKQMFESLGDDCKVRLFSEMCRGLDSVKHHGTQGMLYDALARIPLSATLFTSVLSAQMDDGQKDVRDSSTTPAKKRKGKKASSTVNTPKTSSQETKVAQLKQCSVFLEILQFKPLSDIPDVGDLVPLLFDLLNVCVGVDRSSQPLIEYTKQLLLSNLTKLCQYLQENNNTELREEYFNVEQIVQSIRVSDDPQSHHAALLLLSTIAAIYPTRVLRSIMPIFTFMGATTVRQDNNLSFHVIEQTIQTIIPALLEQEQDGSKTFANAVAIAGVFVDALDHIPGHRQLRLFNLLAETLGVSQYLHIIQALILKALVISNASDSKNKLASQQAQELCHSMCTNVSAGTQVGALVRLTNILAALLHMEANDDEEDDQPMSHENDAIAEVGVLFDRSQYTPKQFRHFTYRIVTFISARLSSSSLRRDVSFGSHGKGRAAKEMKIVQRQFSELLTGTLACISIARGVTTGGTFWGRVCPQLYELLSKINRLLPDKEFVGVIKVLLADDGDLSIQQRCLSLLEERLQSFSFESYDNKETVAALFLPLVGNVLALIEGNNHANPIFEQMCLYTISIFVTVFGSDYPDKFVGALKTATSCIIHYQAACDNEFSDEESVTLLTTAFVCAGKLCASLQLKAIASLPLLMSPVLECADNLFKGTAVAAPQAKDTEDSGASPQAKKVKKSNDAATIRVAFQRSTLSLLLILVNSLPNLMGPYLPNILIHCTARSVVKSTNSPAINDETVLSQYINKVFAKAADVRDALAKKISVRSLLPAVAKAYFSSPTFDIDAAPSMELMLDVLSNRISTMPKSDIASNYHSVFKFLLQAFSYHEKYFTKNTPNKQAGNMSAKKNKKRRRQTTTDEASGNKVKEIQSLTALNQKTVDVLISLILRLSEANFRPLFIKLIDWSGTGCRAARLAVIVQASLSLTKALKSLFVPFFGLLIGDFVEVLKDPKDQLKETPALIYATCSNITDALYHCFLHDDSGFLTKDRMTSLTQPLVNQLEMHPFDDDVDAYNHRVSTTVVPAIRQMAVDVGKEQLWRQINNAVLLKTQHSDANVRLSAMDVVEQFYEHIGDEFLSLLPETVPYVAELMEDDSPLVEQRCQRLIKKIEEFLGGESLTKFL